jgi:nucleoside-diphosphate-sugar epimerase
MLLKNTRMDALIGYTGFVGSNIKNQKKFHYYYNSKNINDIVNKSFDTVVCSGVSSVKWFANLNPKKDYDNIHNLIEKLKTISSKKFILISTIAVYDNPADDAYGRNRLYLENYIRNNFKNHLIIRLPGLFGKGLKKNTIYDLLNNNHTYLPSKNSTLQYYSLENLWKDTECALKNKLQILNISTEPILFKEILDLFSINTTSTKLVHENMKSHYSKYWGKTGDYLYSEDEIKLDLKNYIKNQLK